MWKLLLTFVAVCSILPTGYAREDVLFYHFQRKEGLSNNSVRQIHMDSKGFLWFGTLNGLDRYDGVHTTTYQYHRGEKGALSSNRISRFVEDQLGTLWILTSHGKVQMYNDLDDSFVSLDEFMSEEQKNISIHNIYPYKELEFFALTRNQGFLQIFMNPDKTIRKIQHFSTLNGLPDNQISFLFYDAAGTTWIGTQKGLVTLKNQQIQRVNVKLPDGGAAGNEMAVRSFCVADTTLYFGTRDYGVFTYHKATNTLLPFAPLQAVIGTNIPTLFTAGQNNLYVATYNKGLYRYNRKTGEVQHISLKKAKVDVPEIYEVYVDRYGLIWMETSERGLYQYNPESGQVTYFSLNAEKRQAIGDAEKIIQYEDSYDNLWIGIYGGGICKFNRSTNEFDQYMYDAQNPHSLSSDYVLAIKEDNSKNLWIGTYRGGLKKIKLQPHFLKVGQPVPNAELKIENEVRSLMVDSRNHLWMGTKSGKVFVYDADFTPLLTLPDDLSKSNRFTEAGVYCLMEDSKGNMWIGTKGEGIYVVKNIVSKIGDGSVKNCEVVHFKQRASQPNGLSGNDIYDLLEISADEVWVATHNQGLVLIKNPLGKAGFIRYPAGTNPGDLSNNLLRCFLKDRYNNVWIGSENGLNIVESKYLKAPQLKFKVVKSEKGNPHSISNNDILTLNELANGQIWCGTFGGGINYLEQYNGLTDSLRWKIKTTDDGLASNLVYQMVEDKHRNLWISTDYGISAYHFDTDEFKTYYTKKQQESNAYSENAGDKFRGEKIVFGQVNGFTAFTPDSIQLDPTAYPIYITDLYIDNERVKPGENSVLTNVISRTSHLKLKHHQNFLTFEYAVLDYASPDDIQYAYMLQGFEKDWNAVGNVSRANYKGLPPGEYVFKVKGTNSDGIENDKIAHINIEISAPWWKTGVAFAAYVFLILAFIFVIGYFILRQLQLQSMVKLEKENTDNKLRFYTNISHELKTPLTLIQGPAEELIHSRNLPDSAKFKASEILRNAKRLLELIDQLIDFRKIQKGHIPLKVTQLDITEFFRGIYISFLPLAEKRKINFLFEPKASVVGYLDVDKIEKIVFNLISNAFKHTEKDKSITISFDTAYGFSFSVIDEGSGIDPADLPHIFQRFKLFTKSSHVMDSSSGIGLSITQELVNVHKGTISVNSSLGVGSTFTVSIPIKKENYLPDEVDEKGTSNLHLYDHTEEFIEDMELEMEWPHHNIKRYIVQSAMCGALRRPVVGLSTLPQSVGFLTRGTDVSSLRS